MTNGENKILNRKFLTRASLGVAGLLVLTGGYSSTEYGPTEEDHNAISANKNLNLKKLVNQLGSPYDSHALDNGKVVYRWGNGKDVSFLGFKSIKRNALQVTVGPEGNVINTNYTNGVSHRGFSILSFAGQENL